MRLLAPIARQVLTEMNTSLLLDTGQLTETGLLRTADGGLNASWALSWPEQRAAWVQAIVLQAYFGGRLPPPSSARDDGSRLAAKRVLRRGCRGPATHPPGHCVQRSAQFGLSRGLWDRPCGDSKSRHPARPMESKQRNKSCADRNPIPERTPLSNVTKAREWKCMPSRRPSQSWLGRGSAI